MKAALWNSYGDPDGMEVTDIDVPAPQENEVRVRIHASTVTAGDCEFRTLTFRFPLSVIMRLYVGLFRPKRIRILGQELSGVVDALGAKVRNFQVGDSVIAHTDFTMGAYAEYRCFPAEPGEDQGMIALKPSNLTFEEAAGLPLGGLEALKFLREAAVGEGERVLIIGSAGSIGTIAIQLARHFGGEVTGVDRGEKLQTMHDCGADHVIDYTTRELSSLSDTYDVIFDVVGKTPLRAMLAMLRENGRLILANPKMSQMIRGSRTRSDGKRIIVGTRNRPGDLAELKQLAEDGFLKPIVDRTYLLEEIREAHRYVESGAKKGCVVISIPDHEE